MSKTLILLTSSYPFGDGESFLESEIKFLSIKFKAVLIISNDCTSLQTRGIPENCKVIARIPYSINKLRKVKSILGLFTGQFWKEVMNVKGQYRMALNQTILRTILISSQKAKIYVKLWENLMKDENLIYEEMVFYSYWNNDTSFALSQFKKKHPSVIAVSRMHGSDVFFEANHTSYLPFRREIFKELDKVYSVSKKGKDYYVAKFPKEKLNISVARLGVDDGGWSSKNKSKIFQILSVSNIVSVKNIEWLVLALSKLNVQFFWTHIGEGNLKNEISRLAEEKLKGKFYLAGSMSNRDVLDYYRNEPVDIFVNVSKSEGIPVSIMEAFSFGIPAIATDVGGTSEIVSHKNGILLKPDPTIEEFSAAINYFYGLTQKEYDKYRNEAYATWNSIYNAETNYKKFTDELLSLA